MRALLDTSFFVATESGRPLGEIDQVTRTEVSVVSLAELDAELGPISDADRAEAKEWADKVLGPDRGRPSA
jgi:hypothetical protein